MPYHQIDHIFALGVIFASLDAYNIGANDVANSFATSVSSRSLTLPQACIAAALCEFLGAVLAGARVGGTIKNNIISLSAFSGRADLQALGFLVALMCSATWLMIATRMSWPVSTTYSIVSGIAGIGVAVGGSDAVRWGWNDGRGLSTIFAGWGIAPAIAAGFGAVTYLLVKYIVLVRSNPLRWALFTAPLWFALVTAVLTLSIIYKGAPQLKLTALSDSSMAAAILGTSAVVTLLSVLFWLPFVYCRVVRKDYTVRWYHFFMGPLLWKRQPPADAGSIGAKSAVPDYRVVRDDAVHDPAAPAPIPSTHAASKMSPAVPDHDSVEEEKIGHADSQRADSDHVHDSKLAAAEVGPWYLPKNLGLRIWKMISHGSQVDVHALQSGHAETKEGRRMHQLHAQAVQYDNEVEHLYSFLQVMTACTASFAHGSNDVSNAIGPFAAIYEVWSTSAPLGSNTNIPVWILVFGGIWIVIGLSTYGYNIMRALGNRITLHSPTRGMSMELGAALTVILATIYGLPVSTTMCITGSTVGVGLCNKGGLRAVNWRAIGWIFLGWVLTVPIVGVASGLLMAFIIRSPALSSTTPY